MLLSALVSFSHLFYCFLLLFSVGHHVIPLTLFRECVPFSPSLSVYHTYCLSFCLSLKLPLFLYFYLFLSISLSMFIYLSIFLSLSLSFSFFLFILFFLFFLSCRVSNSLPLMLHTVTLYCIKLLLIVQILFRNN